MPLPSSRKPTSWLRTRTASDRALLEQARHRASSVFATTSVSARPVMACTKSPTRNSPRRRIAATRPSRSTVQRSANPTTSSSRCDTKMIAVPCGFMRASTPNSRSISRVSSAAVGSSRMSSRQRCRSALAMATSWRSAKLSRSTRKSRLGAKSSCASCVASVLAHAGAVDQRNAERPAVLAARSNVRFSATDKAGTSRNSCGMVATPATMASCGLLKWRV